MQIEGKNAVRELFRSAKTVDKILIQSDMRDREISALIKSAKDSGVKVVNAQKSVLDKESKTGKHQGVIAYVTDFAYSSLDDILDNGGKSNFILILDGVEDPHNLGSILRVAECAGVDGVIIGKHRCASVNETVCRVSAGASEHVKVARVTNINYAIEVLKEKGVWVYSADMDGDRIYDTDLTGNCAIIIGSEGFGIHKMTKELSDGVVSIPMFGKVNSLNASVATGVVAYEVVRQRNKR